MIPNRIARLNFDGTTDTSFNPEAGLNAAGICVNLDASGRVIAGGSFNMVDGFLRPHLAFFDIYGSLITGTPTPSATVRTIATQANGEIILGGDFTSIDGTPRNRVARLQSDYTLEIAFNPDANAPIHACALQEDGKILVGGAMTQVGASTRNGVARLYNDPASNVLSVPSLTEAQWLRSGATQEAQQVTFEKDIGAGYVTTGITVSRIDGGWKTAITPSLVTGSIRARAFSTDSHSQGMIEEIVSFSVSPSIEIIVQGEVRTSGVGTVDFGFSQTGVANSLEVNIVNRGLANLTLTSAVLTTGTQWAIPAQPTTPVLPGGSASFTLVFTPTTPGAKTDTVTINSNDPTTAAFTISLAGFGNPGPGAIDTTWQPVANGAVNALSRSPSDFSWVGGLFTTVSSLSRGRYAFINDSAAVQLQAGVGANGPIFCVAQLPDGKVMIGGTFTAVNGVTRNRLARLNSDGSLDTSFNLSVTSPFIPIPSVHCFALQPDGSLIVGGNFNFIGGIARLCLARLTPAGAVDTSFNVEIDTVYSLAIQTDNKIIVGGSFASVYGDYSKLKVCRINPDGTLDNTFAVPAIVYMPGRVTCASIDGTGKILLALAGGYMGDATGLNRVTSVGAIDTTFANNVTDAQSLAVQADGNILVGSSASGSLTSTERLFRLTTLGATDTSFAANARNTVSGVLLQEDGKLLVGGSFTLAGSPRFLARVINGPASSSLTVVGPTEITWARGGTLPECQTVVFDLSQDNGTSWTRLGQGDRISGGWRIIATSTAGPLLPGFFFGSLPVSGIVRARAYVQGGLFNGSVSILEEQRFFSNLSSPDLILQVGFTEILEGGSVPFNAIFGGTSTTTSILLSNIGGADLSNVLPSISASSSSAAGEFSIVSQPAATILANGGNTTLGVQFSPATGIVGYREASLRIVSSNPGLKNPYDVILRGTAIAAPTATTGTVTLIPGGSVTFTGTFKANHDTATAYFQYKLVASNNWISTNVSTLTGFTPQIVSKTVAGLIVDQLYHFRAVIYNTVNNITSIPTTGGNLSPALVFVGTISNNFTPVA